MSLKVSMEKFVVGVDVICAPKYVFKMKLVGTVCKCLAQDFHIRCLPFVVAYKSLIHKAPVVVGSRVPLYVE